MFCLPVYLSQLKVLTFSSGWFRISLGGGWRVLPPKGQRKRNLCQNMNGNERNWTKRGWTLVPNPFCSCHWFLFIIYEALEMTFPASDYPIVGDILSRVKCCNRTSWSRNTKSIRKFQFRVLLAPNIRLVALMSSVLDFINRSMILLGETVAGKYFCRQNESRGKYSFCFLNFKSNKNAFQ